MTREGREAPTEAREVTLCIADDANEASPQNRSTQGRSSISQVQALRGWSRMAR